MSDGQSPEDWRRERALAALARAMRGEDEARPEGSLLSMADEAATDWRRTAAERHRRARQQREAGWLAEQQAETRPVEPYVAPQIEQDIAQPVGPAPSETGAPVVPPLETAGPDIFVPPDEPAVADADHRLEQPEDSADAVAEAPPQPSAEVGSARPDEPSSPPARFGTPAKPGLAASRPMILRMTLLGALIGIAVALLLWNAFGAAAAFLPLAGLVLGLVAGLLLARRRKPEAAPPATDAAVPASIRETRHEFHGDVPDSSLAEAGGNLAVGRPPSVEEIRASLRQLRAATQDLARRRSRGLF